MSDEAIEKLEISLSHHEKQIEELSEIVIRQDKEITKLKHLVSQTEEKLQDYIDNEKESGELSPTEIAARDKPPHY